MLYLYLSLNKDFCYCSIMYFVLQNLLVLQNKLALKDHVVCMDLQIQLAGVPDSNCSPGSNGSSFAGATGTMCPFSQIWLFGPREPADVTPLVSLSCL